MSLPLVYIAGPYTAREGGSVNVNVAVAQLWAAAVNRTELAFAVVPHSLSAGIEASLGEAEWIAGTMEVMRRCDGVIFIPDWAKSSGCVGEYYEALRLGLPVAVALSLSTIEDTVQALLAEIAQRGAR